MSKIAIISDVHGNFEAMKTVLEDIQTRNVDEIYCLGDVIGYGPSPIECLEHALEHCEFILLGNHEEGVLEGALGVHYIAKDAIDWTRTQLKPSFLSRPKTRQLWEQLKKLPITYTYNRFLFVHGSPRDPTYEYILPKDAEDPFGGVPKKIQEIFEQIDHVCFVGHSHKPGIMTQKSKWYTPDEFDGVWTLKEGEKVVCNVGSVGQPRDKDNRACYVTVADNEICYHRVEYDFTKTQEKIRAISELDNILADRLETGT